MMFKMDLNILKMQLLETFQKWTESLGYIPLCPSSYTPRCMMGDGLEYILFHH